MLKRIVFLLPFLFSGAVYADEYEYAEFTQTHYPGLTAVALDYKEGIQSGISNKDGREGTTDAYKNFYEKIGWKVKKKNLGIIDVLNNLGSDGWKVISYNKRSYVVDSSKVEGIEVFLMRED